ncbi:MAG: class II aldolase/adducin family protein [Phycisphaerae bacterium]|nr:class II aldolase/adducin family protein [Phycisphaerae bacterium]
MIDAAADQICAIGRRAYSRGLVAGMEGNISVRLDERRVLCTPTMHCKGTLTPADLCLIDLEGRRLEGARKPSSEMPMHLAAYAADAGVRAVVHLHPPYATTFAVLGESVPTGHLPEAEIFFGAVPLVPYATTGTPAMGEVLRPFVREHCVALLQNHGAVSWAVDLERAYCLIESLEAVCRVVHQARQIGTPREIAAEKRRELADLRVRVRESMRQPTAPASTGARWQALE